MRNDFIRFYCAKGGTIFFTTEQTFGDQLRIAVIYSYAANEAEQDGILDEENSEDTSALDQNSRDFLDQAILDYNQMFHTNYSTDGDSFQNYYKDVSLRMKNKELDLLIVVNMFLTGFDATTLNTLWVDKNLKMHGLIQAFSRTNRILNSIKTFGKPNYSILLSKAYVTIIRYSYQKLKLPKTKRWYLSSMKSLKGMSVFWRRSGEP